MRVAALGILAAQALALALPAYADDVSGMWGATGNAAAAFPVGNDAVRHNGDMGTDLGGMLRYGLSNHWGVGVSYENIFLQHGFRVEPVTLQALRTFWPDNRWTMTALLGAGAASSNPNGRYNNLSTKAGLGFDYFVLPNFSLGPQVTYQFISMTGGAPNQVHTINMGLAASIYFGGRHANKTAAAAPADAKEVVIVFQDAHFDFDQSTLTPEAKAILDSNIRILKENPRTFIRIAGYTSAQGTELYNQKLSERRAGSVRDYLLKNGVLPNRLNVIGYGESRPAEHESNPRDIKSIAAKANMRALFEIVVK